MSFLLGLPIFRGKLLNFRGVVYHPLNHHEFMLNQIHEEIPLALGPCHAHGFRGARGHGAGAATPRPGVEFGDEPMAISHPCA